MLERLGIIIVLFVVSFVAYRLFTHRQLRHLTTLSAESDFIIQQITPGIPTIVYFSTPHCMACKIRQQPIITEIISSVEPKQIKVIEVDASVHHQTANQWGVFSAPTTFIIDEQGITRNVNHGVAEAHILRHQLNLS